MELQALREQIDQIDEQLLALFLKRMELAADVAQFKHENNMPVYIPEREVEVLRSRSAQAGPKMGLYARSFFAQIMDISKQVQKERIAGIKK